MGRPAGVAFGFARGDIAEHVQGGVHFVGIAYIRPGFVAHPCDGGGIELAEVFGFFRIDIAALLHGTGAAFFQRGIVEEGVRAGGKYLGRQWRRCRQIAGFDTRIAVFEPLQQRKKTVHVHGIVQAVVKRLRDERVIGNLSFADDVFQTCDLIRKHRAEQIFAAHALNLRCDFLAAGHAWQRQRGGGVPAPAHAEQRGIQQRLNQHIPSTARVQEAAHVIERKAVAGGEREHDGVFAGGGLQFEIEAATETLAQRQPPGFVDAAAERAVDDELHRAGFIEEAFDAQDGGGGQEAERDLRMQKVLGKLACGAGVEFHFAAKPVDGAAQACFDGLAAFALGEALRQGFAQTRHAGGKFIAAPRRLADPERDRGRCALRVFHAQPVGFHLQDAIGRVTKLEHVAAQAFDREILMYRADNRAGRFQHHEVISGVGNGAAGAERGEPGAASGAQGSVHGIAMQIGAARAAPCGETIGEHANHVGECFAAKVAIRCSAVEKREQRILAPLPACNLCHDLLRQHVDGLRRHDQRVQLATPHAIQQCHRFHQLVAREREQPSLRRCVHRVAGAAYALQEVGNCAW